MTTTTTVIVHHIKFECVAVEKPPLDFQTWLYEYSSEHVEEYLIDEYQGLPEHFAEVLDEVCDAKDACRCWACCDPIGYVLTEDDDTGRAGMEWRTVLLVSKPDDDGAAVAVLCEDCYPDIPSAPMSRACTA